MAGDDSPACGKDAWSDHRSDSGTGGEDTSTGDESASVVSEATTRRPSAASEPREHQRCAQQGAAAHRSPAPAAPNHTRPWRVGSIYPILPGRLSFVVHENEDQTREQITAFPRKYFFSADYQDRYEPFCLDFGPVNLGVVHSFCMFMRQYFNCKPLAGRELVYYSEDPVDLRTNTAFLLAAYVMLEHGKTPEEAWAPFGSITGDAFATFRDATLCEQDYDLTILDCLRGLRKGQECGWYSPDTFDWEEYEYLDHPSNADMHMCTPKLAAFKGPSHKRREIMPGVFTFPPRHFTEVFKDKGVTAVVRLNEAETYNPAGFTDSGLKHYDLYFDDCTVPSNALVLQFLAICEREDGVAVHCRAGLGRTGVMISAYMMKHHGFTAAECIGWLRIVRPGSVIGQQQHYLHFLERALARPQGLPASPPAGSAGGGGCGRLGLPWTPLSADRAAAQGQEVALAQANRAKLRAARATSPGPGGGGGPSAAAR